MVALSHRAEGCPERRKHCEESLIHLANRIYDRHAPQVGHPISPGIPPPGGVERRAVGSRPAALPHFDLLATCDCAVKFTCAAGDCLATLAIGNCHCNGRSSFADGLDIRGASGVDQAAGRRIRGVRHGDRSLRATKFPVQRDRSARCAPRTAGSRVHAGSNAIDGRRAGTSTVRSYRVYVLIAGAAAARSRRERCSGRRVAREIGRDLVDRKISGR